LKKEEVKLGVYYETNNIRSPLSEEVPFLTPYWLIHRCIQLENKKFEEPFNFGTIIRDVSTGQRQSLLNFLEKFLSTEKSKDEIEKISPLKNQSVDAMYVLLKRYSDSEEGQKQPMWVLQGELVVSTISPKKTKIPDAKRRSFSNMGICLTKYGRHVYSEWMRNYGNPNKDKQLSLEDEMGRDQPELDPSPHASDPRVRELGNLLKGHCQKIVDCIAEYEAIIREKNNEIELLQQRVRDLSS